MNALPPARGSVPFLLRVGVTGHRDLPDAPDLRGQIRAAVQEVRRLVPTTGSTPVRLAVVSPLAEGADRLVARIVLEDPDAVLEASLPLAGPAYSDDFETAISQYEFGDLLDRAHSVTVLPETANRSEAYRQAGHFVVDRCDAIIAVWDGRPARGPGGTAEIVAYARRGGIPLVVVDADAPHELSIETADHGPTEELWEAFAELDRFNRARPDPLALAARVEQATADVSTSAAGAGLDVDNVRRFSDWILPHFVRADALAGRAQTAYRWAGTAVFVAAALAVVAVSAQSIFAPDRPELAVAEVAFLLVALGALLYGRNRKVHGRWIAYRDLAERFRSSLYLAMANAEATFEARGVPSPARASPEWVRRAFDEVWTRRPRWEGGDESAILLAKFAASSWLGPQIAYHEACARRDGRRHRRATLGSYAFFAVTLIAAVLHVVGVGDHHSDRVLDPANIVVFLAIALPATAAALAGVEAQHQFQRNADRSRGVAARLRVAERRLRDPIDLAAVRSVMRAVDELTLEEKREWMVTMRFQEIRPA